MKQSERIMLAAAILILDLAVLLVPWLAVVTVYVIVARPPWFKVWVDKLYSD